MVVVLNEVEFEALPPGLYDVEVWTRDRLDAAPEKVFVVRAREPYGFAPT